MPAFPPGRVAGNWFYTRQEHEKGSKKKWPASPLFSGGFTSARSTKRGRKKNGQHFPCFQGESGLNSWSFRGPRVASWSGQASAAMMPVGVSVAIVSLLPVGVHGGCSWLRASAQRGLATRHHLSNPGASSRYNPRLEYRINAPVDPRIIAGIGVLICVPGGGLQLAPGMSVTIVGGCCVLDRCTLPDGRGESAPHVPALSSAAAPRGGTACRAWPAKLGSILP
jgi:hypothetical protein